MFDGSDLPDAIQAWISPTEKVHPWTDSASRFYYLYSSLMVTTPPLLIGCTGFTIIPAYLKWVLYSLVIMTDYSIKKWCFPTIPEPELALHLMSLWPTYLIWCKIELPDFQFQIHASRVKFINMKTLWRHFAYCVRWEWEWHRSIPMSQWVNGGLRIK